MQSTDIYWTVTQILVPPVYIIATSQVCNHWLQAIFTRHSAFGSWLHLHLKINQQQQVVQIRIQVSHVEAVLERWSLITSAMVATHAEHKRNTFCWQCTFLHNSTIWHRKITPSQEGMFISFTLIVYTLDHIGTARHELCKIQEIDAIWEVFTCMVELNHASESL